jgi:Myb/SANT-like DNA-binding domain
MGRSSEIIWEIENKQHLVDAMKAEHDSHGFLGDNGSWKTEQTNRIVTAFNTAKGGDPFDKSQITSQISILKKEYLAVKDLESQSGFGWDYEQQCVTAPEEVWRELIKSKKDFSKLKGKKFPFYEVLSSIYDGALAKGDYAASSSDSATSTKKRKKDVVDDDFSYSPTNPRRSPRNHSTPKTPKSSKSAKKKMTQSQKSEAATRALLQRLVENQEKAHPTEAASSLFLKSYSSGLNLRDRIQIQDIFGKEPHYAAMFLRENDEGKQTIVEMILARFSDE